MLFTEGDNKIVVHVMSMLPTMNQVQLEDGDFPEADDECALDVDYLKESSLEIGDKITLISGTDDDVSDTLRMIHIRSPARSAVRSTFHSSGGARPSETAV